MTRKANNPKGVVKEASTAEEPALESQAREVGAVEVPVDVGPDTGESLDTGEQVEAPAVDPIELLKQELEQSKENYLRLAAEFDNYRKRTQRDFAMLVKTASEELITELLEVLDNFDRALTTTGDLDDGDALLKGILLVRDKLVDILGRYGLKRFESVGQKFDPYYHEAVMQVEQADAEPDTIAQEFLPGYVLHEKVVRHAKVSVVKAKAKD